MPARGGTNRVAGVALRESHAFFGDLVDVRRADFRLAEGTDIAVAEVIGEEEDDVGSVGGEAAGQPRESGREEEDEQESDLRLHGRLAVGSSTREEFR